MFVQLLGLEMKLKTEQMNRFYHIFTPSHICIYYVLEMSELRYAPFSKFYTEVIRLKFLMSIMKQFLSE